ncbi:uncharacterized protein PV09_09264 [Verruconis gallopava]|uniref:Uncharacterized protein n=1 Tax=Verruconis gallopava TaxID=253628 RepID=A0A0D2AJ98_9PEZI|nr:uncharacterized protein PV09_09264 [Verruconis gallopava]KIV98983.1 hypothetical protein PV09_09264 [Verruconis gallopava]
MNELQSGPNSRTNAQIESWREDVEEAHRYEEPHFNYTDGSNLIEELPQKVDRDISPTHASTEPSEDFFTSLLGDLNLDSTVRLENTAETKIIRTPKENNSGGKSESLQEENKNEADQQAKRLEEIQRYITQQKRSAREEAAAQAKQVELQKVTKDILELIALDTLVKHTALDINLSDSWERVLMLKTACSSIEMFLAECAPDPYAWSVLRREGYFALHLSSAIRGVLESEDRPKDREFLLTILESLLEIFNGDVEWDIVPDNVPRALVRRAIAVARDGPDPPNYEWGEDSQTDAFLIMVANKSESSLFGTPDSDNPRYWDYWMRRGGFGSKSS